MTKALRIAVLGSGALGGLYAACLHDAGYGVHLFLRSDYRHVVKHGLQVRSPWGDRHCQDLHCYNDLQAMPIVDVVLVCWKAYANGQLAELLSTMVHPQTLIVFVQNGLGAEDSLAAAFPEQPMAAGLAFLCANRVSPGCIHHLDYGLIVLAPWRSADTDSVEVLRRVFQRAGVPIEMASGVHQARWQKLVWNMPFNGLCTLYNCTTDVIISDPDRLRQAQIIMREVVTAATATGAELAADTIEVMIDRTARMRPYQPSMLMDRLAGRRLELDAIYRQPIALAKQHGAAMPESAALVEQLAAYEFGV